MLSAYPSRSASAELVACCGLAALALAGYLLRKRKTLPSWPAVALPTTSAVRLRMADVSDVKLIFTYVRELAEFESLLHEVVNTDEMMVKAFMHGHYDCVLAEARDDGSPIGMALFYHSYSTFEGLSLYLEDLYVRPNARGMGCGTLLLKSVAVVAESRGCARLQWQALSWNAKAVEFYASMGARQRVDGATTWLNFIMRRPEIAKLAAR